MPDIGERRLATIRTIAKIEPIEGADKIVKATVDGWELVTQKDNYKVGDLCLYFEIDAFLPVREEFEFLRKGCFKSTTNLGDGFRIKTIKLRGQVSQGLSLPLSDFFERKDGRFYYMKDVLLEPSMMPDKEAVWLEEGTDVTEYLKVQKYEKPVHSPGSRLGPMHAKGSFPSFIPKTDQERVQNCLGGIKKWVFYGKPEVTEITKDVPLGPEFLKALEAGLYTNTEALRYFKSGEQWFRSESVRNPPEVIMDRTGFEWSLKVDGSSMTVYHNDGTYGVCSRNFDLKRDPDSVFWQTALSSGVLEFMVQDGRNVGIQGELMGPGVQGNREGFEHHKFFVFDVYDIDAKRHMTPAERDRYMANVFEMSDPDNVVLEHVPLIGDGILAFTEDLTVSEFLKYANIKSINHPIAEGVVFKSIVEGGPSFKAINNEFLLKEKD